MTWMTLAPDTSPEYWDDLSPGKLLDVGGHKFQTYRVVQVDREHSRVQVEEVSADVD